MDKHQAIYKLYPNVKYINNEIAYDANNNIVTINESLVQTELNKEAYKDARASAYKSLAEQLDMQYWDRVNGTSTWKEHIDAVKAAHPKPTE